MANFTINGTVRVEGAPVLGAMRVLAFDRDLPSRERRAGHLRPAGEGEVEADGRFTIEFDSARFAAGEGRAPYGPDLYFRVVDDTGTDLVPRQVTAAGIDLDAAGVLFNAANPLDVVLLVTRSVEPEGESEYGRLLAVLSPVLGDLLPRDLVEDDVDFLLHESGDLDRDRLSRLVTADLLAPLCDVPTAALYGWARMNVPDRWDGLPLGETEFLTRLLDAFGATETGHLADALRTAASDHIVPARLADLADELAYEVGRRGRVAVGVRLRLVADPDRDPLAGYRVSTFDEGGRDLGDSVTDALGEFGVRYETAAGAAAALRLRVSGPRLTEPVELAVEATLAEPVVIGVPVPAPSPALRAAGVLPPDVVNLAEAAGVISLADIRRRGGVGGIDAFATLDAAARQRLAALTDLDRLGAELPHAAILADRGYPAVSAIADAPWATFLRDVAADPNEEINDPTRLPRRYAIELRAAAEAQVATLDLAMTGSAVELANGYTLANGSGPPLPMKILGAGGTPADAATGGADGAAVGPADGLPALLAPPCGCADCESAVSPGAYLASLLDYAVKHIQFGDRLVAVDDLEARFHQPVGELPLDCAAADRLVPQVRLAVEVLRAYVGVRPMRDPARETALQEGEAAYLLAAYTGLLVGSGVTFDDLRRARTAPAQDRAALAGQLGIDIADLDRLYLDPRTDLSEAALQRIFGLAGTTADPLSDGPVPPDASGQLNRWRLAGVEAGRNTDPDGQVHLSMVRDGATYRVRLYADPARDETSLIAAGARATATGPVRLISRNSSGLSGVVELAYTKDVAAGTLAAAPRLLCWRLARLRAGWLAADWPPTDIQPAGAQPAGEPLVDPRVIGFADLRAPRVGMAAYDVWLARSAELSDRRAALIAVGAAVASPLAGFAAAVSLALSLPDDPVDVTGLDALAADERAGKRIGAELAALGLSAAAFAFLMPRLDFVRSGEPLLDREWELVVDTLVDARRRRDASAWRAEERAAGITLSLDHFRVAALDRAPEPARGGAVPLWLSTWGARKAWAEVLTARLDQEAAAVTGLGAARSTAEEATLPILRDALVAASDAEPDDPAERAEWLTRRLLIDLRMSGSQRTTRVEQALETLQELLFRLRTGQFVQDNPSTARLSGIRAVATADGFVRLVARDADNGFWERVWDGQWRSWRYRGQLPGGSSPASDLAVAARGPGFDVAVVGGDRRLWHRRYESGWTDWQQVAGADLLTGSPALTARGPDALDAYMLRQGDLRVLRRSWAGGAWGTSDDVGTTSHRMPAAASREPTTVDLVLGRPDPTLFAPLHRAWDGARWQDTILSGTLASDPALVATGPAELHLLQNNGGDLWHARWDAGGWQPWENLDPGATDSPLSGGITATSPAAGLLVVAAVRKSAGSGAITLWQREFEAGAWSAWQPVPDDHFDLVAPQFEAEWEWIGSYATWRAAMFVRLYPHNLLLPALASRQTPAFRTLLAATRPTRRISRDDACASAIGYAAYLRDVSSLRVAASCDAEVTVRMSDPCSVSSHFKTTMFLFFGLSRGTLYSSSFAPTLPGPAHSFWSPIDLAESVGGIVGAQAWRDHVQVFYTVGGDKLKCVRLKLELVLSAMSTSWDLSSVWEEPTEISNLPVPLGSTNVMLVQSDQHDRPRLTFHFYRSTVSAIDSTAVYIREVNDDCSGFVGPDDWGQHVVVVKATRPESETSVPTIVDALLAVVSVRNAWWIIYRRGPASYRSFVAGESYSAVIDPIAGAFLGAFPGDVDRPVFLFFRKSGTTSYLAVRSNGTYGPVLQTADITSIAIHSGSSPRCLVAAESKHTYLHSPDVNGDRLDSGLKYDLVPFLGSATSIPLRMSAAETEKRRVGVQTVYQENAAASDTVQTVLREAYRLVPQQLALALAASGDYTAALDAHSTVYDYRAPLAERYVDYGLALDAALPPLSVLKQPADWLTDPLNPHAIARTRRGAVTRFAITSIIQCLNAYADSEFTADSSESLVRARLLYDTARNLCDAPELHQSMPECDAVVAMLDIQPGENVLPEAAAALGAIKDSLTEDAWPVPFYEKLKDHLTAAMSGATSWSTAIDAMQGLLESAAPPPTAKTSLVAATSLHQAGHALLLADAPTEKSVVAAGSVGAAVTSGWAASVLLQGDVVLQDSVLVPPPPVLPAPPLRFCVPADPMIRTLRTHAELGLAKLRSGRNIAGMRREVPAYSAPTDTVTGMPIAVNGQIVLPGVHAIPPTAHRYAVLIARAKELAAYAAQIEGQYQATLERLDDARYSLLRARQELTLTTAQVRLQKLRVAEANKGVKLSQLQSERALIQQQTYETWIANGLNAYEQQLLDSYLRLAKRQKDQATAVAAIQTAQAFGQAATAPTGKEGAAAAMATVVGALALGATGTAWAIANAQADISVASLMASHERRLEEWRLQAALAAQDQKIGAQEVDLAQGEVAIAEMEQSISETQETQARDTVEFLGNRPTGVELFDFMSGVLADVYRTLLQQATAVLNLARAQLAFERQQTPPVTIRSDYWTAAGSSPVGTAGDNHLGLTGSARLLADLLQLDQYAFDTERRKIAVSKTLSLAQLAPAEFQTFRSTGVLPFSTPMELFDRDFPGHYLRLIRRVRISVIALVPPIEGVRATLANTGISRVVVGPEPFQAVTVRREPETVALSVPIGASGVFEGEAPDGLYLPFEGSGVDSSWELRLPRAANRFDYRTISDVLLTVDYLALNNYDYGQTVIKELDLSIAAERAFSLRNDFPDAWYDLNNPEQLAEPDRLLVRLRVTRDDFPANLDRLLLKHLTLYAAGQAEVLRTLTVESLTRTDPTGATIPASGRAKAAENLISTRRGNGAPWQPLIGAAAGRPHSTPIGDWTISLRAPGQDQGVADGLASGGVDDILLILGYVADTPPWPT